MSCFLPSLCIFCVHFDHSDDANDGVSCKAFDQIPDEIFMDKVLHTVSIGEDKGISFELNRELEDEYLEMREFRMECGLAEFPVVSS